MGGRPRPPGPVFNPRPAEPSGGGGGGSGTSIPTLDEVIADSGETANTDIGGVISVTFGVIDLDVSQSAVKLYVMQPGATPSAEQGGLVIPYRGSIAAISFAANDSKSAGACDFRAYADGLATDMDIEWTDGLTKDYAVLPQGTAVFEAGTEVDVRVTTDGSFAPTTVDVRVTLFIALNPTNAL